MKKPLFIFTIKCAVVIYITAFTNIDIFTMGKSATPLITKGNCKIQIKNTEVNPTKEDFVDYTFTFTEDGNVIAFNNQQKINGKWIEDNINKKITIHFPNYIPSLEKLNNSWSIKHVQQNELQIENNIPTNLHTLTLASLNN